MLKTRKLKDCDSFADSKKLYIDKLQFYIDGITLKKFLRGTITRQEFVEIIRCEASTSIIFYNQIEYIAEKIKFSLFLYNK